jgi:hypothetical protein
MSDCTERHTPPPHNDMPGEGQKGMPRRLSMSDCTERHTPPPHNDMPGEGQEGMPKEGTA